jgi:hypothetical protein
MKKRFLLLFIFLFNICTGEIYAQEIGTKTNGGIYIGHGIVINHDLLSVSNHHYFNFEQASKMCKKLNSGGFKDWVIPTIEELEFIYDYADNNRSYGGFPEPIWPGVTYLSCTTNNRNSRWMFYMISKKNGGGSELKWNDALGYILPIRHIK